MGEYFGRDVDVRIKEFCQTTDIEEKNRIFVQGIRPAFVKLIESQMFVYRFNKIDDPEMMKNDCLSTLYELLPKFDPNRGKKAFSYFNVVVKNWFIWKIREQNKRARLQSSTPSDAINSIDIAANDAFTTSSYEDEIIDKEFWVSLYTKMDTWRNLLQKKTEKQVLEAIIFLLQNPQMISIYNKKAVYLYIREITGLNTKQVIHNLKGIKTLYERFRAEFTDGEEDGED